MTVVFRGPVRSQSPRSSMTPGQAVLTAVLFIGVIVALATGVLSWLFSAVIGIVVGAGLAALAAVGGTVSIVKLLPSAIGVVPLAEPIVIGAVTGLVAGWLRRAFSLKRHGYESLLSALAGSRFWTARPTHAFLHLALHAVVGALVGALLSSGGIWLPSSAAAGGLYPLAGGGLGGTGGGGGPFELYVSLLAILLMAAFIGIVAMIILDPIIARTLVSVALSEGVREWTEHAVTVLVYEWDRDFSVRRSAGLRRAASRERFLQGALTGAVAGAVMLLMR